VIDGKMDSKLNEETLYKGVDRRSFLQVAGKAAVITLGMVFAQSMGDFSVSAEEAARPGP
jgi:alkaline phosphatase D